MHAEVSDKMASIPQLWVQGIVIAIILFALVRWSVWLSIFAIVVITFFGIATYETLADPYVGPAIMKEQGVPYAVSAYSSVVAMLIGFVGGFMLNRRKLKKWHLTITSNSPPPVAGRS